MGHQIHYGMRYAVFFGSLFIAPFILPALNPAFFKEIYHHWLMPDLFSFEPGWLALLVSLDLTFTGFFFPGILLLLLAGLAVYAYRIRRRWQAGQRQLEKQKQHIRQLQSQRKEVERKMEQKIFLFSGLSHILSEALDRLVKHAGILEDESPSAGQKRESQLSIQEGQQLLKLFMEDIQELSKSENPQFQTQEETINLNQFLHELHSCALREKAYQKRKELTIHFRGPAQRDAFYIQTDRKRMKQILSILIRHSIRYTHHGCIEVSYQVLEHALQFSVENSGLGFTSSEYSDLFHFFRRKAKMMSRSPAERQMELILAGEIIHHMKGEIHAESKEQGGTRFILKLPFTPLPGTGNTIGSKESGEEETVYDWTGKTILVVEDSKMAYELIEKMFSNSGATFDLEPDGIKAVERCKGDDTIDLVLMDIQLPLMDGYKATREIKKIRPGLPIIAQTANALAGDRKKAREAGCDEYIAKPIDIDEMGDKIDQILH